MSKNNKVVIVTEDMELASRVQELERLEVRMTDRLEKGDIVGALNAGYMIVDELRTPTLSPKLYYSIFLRVQTIFTSLISALESSTVHSTLKLYEYVQYYPHAVPRLYLMCAVGSACITRKEASITDMLKDLVEMTKCIQHPTKGLFLRSYLLDCVKSHLPDVNTENPGREGTLADSVDFLIVNFTEMNKLNMRLTQKQKDCQLQLCQLVAKNISILANIEGVTKEEYRTNILPQILQQIIICADVQSQLYLIDAVIHVFPTQFHLITLRPLLKTILVIPDDVVIVELLHSVIERLCSYCDGNGEKDTTDIYPLFNSIIEELLQIKNHPVSVQILSIIPAYITLLEKWYTSDVTMVYIKQLIMTIHRYLLTSFDNSQTTVVNDFLSAVYREHNIMDIIQMDGFFEIIDLLPLEAKHLAHKNIITRFIQSATVLRSADDVHLILNATLTIHKDLENVSIECILEDSSLSTSLIQSIKIRDPEEELSVLRELKGIISMGCPQRRKIALPGLLFKTLQIEPKDRKIFVAALDVIKTLVKQGEVLLSVKLAIYCTLCGSTSGVDATSFFELATALFENNLSNASERKEALEFIVGGIASMRFCNEEKYSVMATSVTKYSQFFEDIPTRCVITSMCSSLWAKDFGTGIVSKSHCLACLQKALKEANLSPENVKLFVYVFNRYVALYAGGQVDLYKYIEQLMEVIKANIININDPATEKFFFSTCEYLQYLNKSHN